MKYSFVYDKDFEETHFVELSNEEIQAVVVTVVGGHNAIFYGYKPERIVKAIKLLLDVKYEEPPTDVTIKKFCGGGPNLEPGYITLANGGVLLMENLHNYKASVLQMLRIPLENKNITLSRAGNSETFPADFQLIATTQACPCGNYTSTTNVCLCSERSKNEHWKKMECVTDRCGILFKCEEGPHITKVSIKMLKTLAQETWNNHKNRTISSYKDATEKTIEELSPTDECKLTYEVSILGNTRYSTQGFEIAKVARTIADYRAHGMVRVCDLVDARDMYNLCV